MDPKKLRKILFKQPSNIKQSIERAKIPPKASEPGKSISFLNRKRNTFMGKKSKRFLKSKEEEFKDLNRLDTRMHVVAPTKRKFQEDYSAQGNGKRAKQSNDNKHKHTGSTTDQLRGSQFRFLNELLYTQSSEEAVQMFKNDPEAFQIYHDGFESQRQQWPKDPLLRVVKFIQKLPKSTVVADFGCGDARLAVNLPEKKVHSFDFIALNERITACDMRKTPLKPQAVDVAVFCLSLMGTNCNEFIKEANRVLKVKGILSIVEISSRIQRLTRIVNQIEKMGFTCIDKAPADFFVYLTFMKQSGCPKGDLPPIILNPCTYKKR